MSLKSRFLLGRVAVFGIPFVFVLIMVGLLLHTHIAMLRADINEEYERIGRTLSRASKALVGLDYSLNSYSLNNTNKILLSRYHWQKQRDQLCFLFPTKDLKRQGSQYLQQYMSKDSYAVVGETELCDFKSKLALAVESRIQLAPLLALFHNIDDAFISVHYQDIHGYLIVSPENLSKNITPEIIAKIKDKNWSFYQGFQQSKIKVQGPFIFEKVNGKRPILTLMLPVYKTSGGSDIHGSVALDIDVLTLLRPVKLTNSYFNIVTEDAPVPDNAFMLKEIDSIEGIDFHHKMYYLIDFKNEILRFLTDRKMNLVIIFIVYFLSVFIYLYIKSYREKHYFKELAAQDPLTGLNNRRGFETFLTRKTHDAYVAMVLIDIDNFKQINDTYGHDVGDDVICYLADGLKNNIRTSDSVARFGGEEFIIYLTGESKDALERTIHRVKDEITNNSTNAVESGFTISGGVSIYSSDRMPSHDQILKVIDNKLYFAKRHGKNRLVF
ncbi:GGDEF domain-containing protein [Vibrio salinus]|uniref:GGDEF domain-containing protein n=1 Tax=Vibrio salinus TaxID=2899784 RepID=UPI001E59550A|nr:GGDEF domain-containing protein [Vibrio salinus]MCE0496198.1 GGDEF domain-containing protein [Vibrio salinus]